MEADSHSAFLKESFGVSDLGRNRSRGFVAESCPCWESTSGFAPWLGVVCADFVRHAGA